MGQNTDAPLSNLEQQAIEAALKADWEQALILNQQILKKDPKNTDGLNRLARAYFELGNFPQAKKYYHQTLKLDPYNQITHKFLKNISTLGKGKKSFRPKDRPSKTSLLSPDLFLEEPGRTKVVNLINIAEPQKLSILSAGLLVKLTLKNHTILALSDNDQYLGALPDDLAHRLIRLIRGGNKYQTLIRTVKSNQLSILIREIHRSSRFKNQASFPPGSGTFAYSTEQLEEEGEEVPLMESSLEEQKEDRIL